MLFLDAIQLMDALQIDQFFVAGHDWGSNIAEALALAFQNAFAVLPCFQLLLDSAV
jgi:pimeloyl-ACP methyl ester carboxylesterase